MNEEKLKKRLMDDSICINCGEKAEKSFDHFGEDVMECPKCGWVY